MLSQLLCQVGHMVSQQPLLRQRGGGVPLVSRGVTLIDIIVKTAVVVGVPIIIREVADHARGQGAAMVRVGPRWGGC